jgi:multiphosphoryl transfer protein
MIGIVVVSHSRALADAAVALAREMVKESDGPKLAVAAGLDGTGFGTDATAVAAAVAEVDGPDGVLVLLDLGSAVLSAEMALEFLDPGVAGRVRLSAAPLVEGLVAAVVLASTGADLDAVAAEARLGLLGKQQHLDLDPSSAPPAPRELRETSSRHADTTMTVPAQGGGAPPPSADVTVTVSNRHGLHARPAARVVGLVRGFDAEVMLTNLDTGRGPVSAGSLSAVATLDTRQGHRLAVRASGAQAVEAVQAFEELAAHDFGDQPPPAAAGPSEPAASGSGLDLAMGPAMVRRAEVDVSSYEPGAVEEETRRSRRAVAALRLRLEDLERRTTEGSGADAGAIFAAHLALLDDPGVTEGVDADLAAGVSAVDAWRGRLDAVARGFDELPDAYQRERAADVRSIQSAVLRALTGRADPDSVADGAPVVLIVDELDAATAAAIDAERVAGVAVVARGDTGHGVIIASSRGIPVITGVGSDAADVRTGQVVAFDARREFWAHPSEEDQSRWSDYVDRRRHERVTLVEAAKAPATTVDGTGVPVLANIASVADAESAATNGADGSGLVRTEVLFGDRDTAPSVEEQTETFLALADALDGRPLTIRTWDIGGDKPLPFLPMAREVNPFLGVRGIRAFAFDPRGDGVAGRLFRDQLTAICRAARETPIRVMFPMVTNPGEVGDALRLLKREAARDAGLLPSADESAGGGRPRSEWRADSGETERPVDDTLPEGLEVGVMIEVPAAAMAVDLVAVGLDFVSIGTNDLTQYATAADRGNDAVAELADPLSAGVLRLIDHVCRRRPAGVEVGVCGDLASRPRVVPLLLGLGVDELSCTPPKVPDVKAAVRRTDLDQARSLAAQVLAAHEPAEVRELL